MRVVMDTNTLVAAAYSSASASRRLVEACLRGDLVAVLSPALQEEYEFILGRAVRVRGYDESLRRFLREATLVEPADTPRVVPEDPDDDKLVAVARAAGAAIVTNDRHLLGLDLLDGIRILRPEDFLRLRPGL
jgi:putative PIN family toxin of toxin-antitoxin system